MAASSFTLNSTATAIALVLPTENSADVNALRSIHDKAYRKWPPHINILYPCVHPDQLPDAISRLRAVMKERPSSTLQILTDRVGKFEHRRNATIFLQPSEESDAVISGIRSELVKALELSDQAGTHDGVFRPHMTIGQAALIGGQMDKLVGKVEKLRGLKWENATLAVLKRKTSGEMEVIDDIHLSDNTSQSTDITSKISSNPESSSMVWSPCFSFRPAGGWKVLQTDLADRPPESRTISILSYNLMADTFGYSFADRLPLITQAIKDASHSSNEVLCLQEVSDGMLQDLLSDKFIQEKYPYSSHSPSSVLANYLNLVTLSTEPFAFTSHLFTERHKSSLVIRPYSTPVEIANLHLTAALKDEAVSAKQRQITSLTDFMIESSKSSGRYFIVAGDFNIATSSKTIEAALIKKDITFPTSVAVRALVDPDIWSDAYILSAAENSEDGEVGATFDVLTNPIAAESHAAIESRPQRYDRILFSKHAPLIVSSFSRFGFPDADGKCGSDHFGIAANLRIAHQAPQTMPSALTTSACNISLIQDSTPIVPLISPFLPSVTDSSLRLAALSRLTTILSSDARLSDIQIAPLGSYSMDTYFPESDIDVLAIGSLSPSAFFNVATLRLRSLINGLKGFHYINSLVPVIEIEILSIKFDVQYCQAPELLARFNISPNTSLEDLVFDELLVQQLQPAALRPLNTYRDTQYILRTLPIPLPIFQTTHRFLSLYLRNRGLYSAKFGYLGGIHLTLLLNHLIKRLSHIQTQMLTPASLIRTFLSYYSAFDWLSEIVHDPLHPHTDYHRSLREPIAILALHSPTARPNVSGSCTRFSATTISKEFSRALSKPFEWFMHPASTVFSSDFLRCFSTFLIISIDIWNIPTFGTEAMREFLGGVESRIPSVLVNLSRIEDGLYGQGWPFRLRSSKDEVEVGQQFKCYYLVGTHAPDGIDQSRQKIVTGKFVQLLRDVERMIKDGKGYNEKHVWVEVKLKSKKRILDLELELS